MKKVLDALTQMQVQMPIQNIILVLVVAFILSMIIYLTYKYTYNGVVYNQRFNFSIVMITMITTMVMIVIGSNISVSLGMVGALSIVRFRTAVKDPRDTAFIFWGIVAGLSCGTQCFYVALIGSLVICLIAFGFKKFTKSDNKYVLIIRGNSYSVKDTENELKKHVKDFVCKGKYINDKTIELIYEVQIKKDANNGLLENMYRIEGVNTVNMVQSNTETMG